MFPRGRADLGSRELEDRACDRVRSPTQLPSLKINCRATHCPRCLFSAVTFVLWLLNHKCRTWVCWTEFLWIYAMLYESRVSSWSLWFMWYMAHTAGNDRKSSSAFLWIISGLYPKRLNFLDIYSLVNENTLGYVIRMGSSSLLFYKIRPKIAQYFGTNFISLKVDCEIFGEEDIRMLENRYVVTRLKFAHCSEGEESKCVWDDSYISPTDQA